MPLLDVLVAGVAHSLNDGVTSVLIEQDGIGMTPVHRVVERGPQQHGESDRGFRLDPRVVQLVLGVQGDNLYAKRDLLAQWFKPTNNAISLRWTREDAAVRQLDCYYLDSMGLGSNVKSRYWLKVPAQFKAEDPTFYDPALVQSAFGIALGGDEMVIPLVIPWEVGTSVLDSTTTIAYPGTWRTYPVLVITGPVDDLVITNNATGEKLDWTGADIGAGTTRTVDLRYGHKTVVDGGGVDKAAELTTDSDMATWHIADAPDAPGGNNSIHVTGANGTAATRIIIQYYKRYVSL
jgi:hypothetical protein